MDDDEPGEDGWFGDAVAATYDQDSAAMSGPGAVGPVVELLADLAGGGPALELAIGTGRIALPLAARGIDVHGVELSRAMVARLRAKPGGDRIPVTVADIASVRLQGRFSLVYLVFNTIMNLTTQRAQVDCFRTAAAHLEPGGRFVVEVMVPQVRLLPPGQTVVPFQVDDGGWAYDVYDVATQRLSSNYVRVVQGRGSFRSIPFRYAWPAELDLMAELAGLALENRWADWGRAPFTSDSVGHVSVWRAP